VDYGVEADEYRGGVIFRSVRAGAFSYVPGPLYGIARRSRSHPVTPEGNARMKQEPSFFEAGAFFYVLPNVVARDRGRIITLAV